MHKKHQTIIGILLILLLISTAYCFINDRELIINNNSSTILFTPQDSAIMSINNVKIYKQEYLLHLKKEIALTYNYFYLKYGAKDHPSFWTTTYGDIKPIDYLKARTNEKIINSKNIHLLVTKNKVIKGFDFNEFLLQWKMYNKKRQEKNLAGEVVYGPVNISMAQYYFYLLSNLKIKLTDKIKKEKFSPNQNTLKSYYETIKQEKFSYSKIVEIEQFGFTYEDFSYKKAVNKIKEISKRILRAPSLCCDLKKEYPKSIYKKNVFYDSIPINGEDNPDKILKITALELEYGKIKTLRTQEGIYILKLTKPLVKEYYPYEKVQSQVLDYYQNENFNDYLSQLKKEVVIITNDKIYKKLSSEDFK